MRGRAITLALCLALVVGCASTGPGPGRDRLGGPAAEALRPLPVEGVTPRAPDQYVAEARQALVARDYRGAAEAARAASLLEPTATEPRILEARAREAMGDWAGALPLWRDLASKGEGGLTSLASYASLALRRGEGAEALRLVEERLRAAPDNPELHGVAGWVALGLGRAAEARSHLEATEGTPVSGGFAVHLGRARLLAGDLVGAATAAEQAVEAEESAAGWVLLGDIRRTQGLAAAAERSYRRALELESSNFAARVNLGVLMLSQGEPAQAAEQFAAATESRPDVPQGWNNLGLARRAQGDLKGAREAYERALGVSPEFAPALKNMGILHEKYLASPAAALPYYDRYLAAHPDDEEVARWRKAAKRLAQEGDT